MFKKIQQYFKTQTFKQTFNLFITLRFLTLAAAIVGYIYLPFKPSFPYWDAVLSKYGHPLTWSWANFDGVHYLMLSKEGYNFGLTQAFFPVYFLIIKTVSFVLGNPLFSALLISHLFFLLSLVIFYKLLKLDYSKSQIHKVLLFLILFPTSFYFLGVYNESLFLFLVLTSFYLMRTGKIWQAGLVGAIASATRVTGILLIPAFLIELSANLKTKKNDKKLKSGALRLKNCSSLTKQITSIYSWVKARVYLPVIKNTLAVLIPSFLPLLGLLCYMFYLNYKFSDPFMFAHVQSSFGAGRQTDKFVLLYQVFWRYLKMILTVDKTNPIYYTIWLELVSTLTCIALLIIGFIKKVRPSYLLFGLLSFIIPTLTGMLSSMPRYVLTIFPIFISLGLIQNKKVQKIILFIFAALLIINTMLFTRGYWIA
jgi:hypothetical protein